MEKKESYGREIGLDEVKTLQMDVLEAIDEYCCGHNIRYSLSNGTLLGAIRHKGYIPWDDDIDIYVPRNDYQRLISDFPEVYKDRYKIASLERDPLWEYPFAKAYDAKTIMLENIVIKEDIGVNIDIFPIDDVPDEDAEWMSYDHNRRKRQKLFELKFIKFNKNRSLLKNCVLLLSRIVLSPCSTRRYAKYLDKFSQMNNGKGYNRCFECCQGIFQKRPFAKVLFDNIKYIPFEDRHFRAFSDADSYLKNGFGDYMKLPPVEKRVSHHVFKAFWK